MRYPAVITKEGKQTVAVFHFADGTETSTFADPGESIEDRARAALVGVLASYLSEGDVPPKPGKAKGKAIQVDVPVALAIKLMFRWARHGQRMSQGDLALVLNVTRQQVAKWEHPDSNPGIKTLEKWAHALNAELDATLKKAAGKEAGRAR